MSSSDTDQNKYKAARWTSLGESEYTNSLDELEDDDLIVVFSNKEICTVNVDVREMEKRKIRQRIRKILDKA